MRFPSSALIPFLSAALAVGPSTLFAQSGPKVYVKDGHCASTEPVDLALPDLLPGRYYSVLATLTDVRASNDSKLRVELFDPTGMPTGKVLHQGDPDLQFTFRPRIAGVSVLRIARSTERGPVVKAIDDATRPVARDRKAIALVQDDANLVDAMREGDGDVRLVDQAPYSGRSALRVQAAMRIGKNVPGWGYRITEKPAFGEFRYLRFAWKLETGDTAAVALADQGELGDPTDGRLRYSVGNNLLGWGSTTVADAPPREWTVVTRDLWQDRGDFTLTGIGLVPALGTLWFDHAYVARSLEDLDAITPATVAEALQRGSSDGLEALVAHTPPSLRGPFVNFGDELSWRVEIREIATERDDGRRLESEPNDQWNMADEFGLGTAVHGGADDIEYLDNTHEGKVGWDWLRFSFNDETPKLVFFTLDCADRDVPATMKLYVRDEVGRLVGYTRGKDPTEVRHDNQDASIAGWKFLSRVVSKGTYWLHVKANHPSYVLRTTLHDVPPYTDPRAAVRTAAEYAVQAGDSFFANVPRGGAVRTRLDTNTDETTRCFACHAGHYPVISNLAAHRNGYRTTDNQEFRNLIDRVYEVGVPLYGHDGATWARFDLAPTTGIARVGTMICDFEAQVRKRPTDAIVGPARFAELVYGTRTELPRRGDRTEGGNYEFDGNRSISDARVATEAWRLFDELARRTGSDEWRQLALHMQELIATARVKDNEDLVEQSLGMLAMDRERFAPQIAANMERLRAKVHHDGGFVTAEYLSNLQVNELEATNPLDLPHLPSLTFFTAQAAYALLQTSAPGDEKLQPLLQRAAALLLQRQLEFGGWVDPQGELFRTPYLETKWAVMFLAQLFPENATATTRLELPGAGRTAAQALQWLQAQWRLHDEPQVTAALSLLDDELPLLRTAAALALQRLAWNAEDPTLLQRIVAPLRHALADDSKAVARAAAVALRTLGNEAIGRAELLAALTDPDVRTRRAATRVFVHRFWNLARDPACLDAVLARIDDSDFVVRMHALKAAQQWWYRAATAQKPAILARIIARARHAGEHSEVLACIEKGLHNICDENTAELYGNDSRVMATDRQRERIRHARDEIVERDLGEQFAAELRAGTRQSRLVLLRALGMRIRRGAANGNDTDDVVLEGSGGAVLAKEVLVALADQDPEIREHAAWAVTAVRKHANHELVAALLRTAGDQVPAVRTASLRALDVVEVHGQDLPAHGIEFEFLSANTIVDEAAEDRCRAALRWLRRDPSSQRPEFVGELLRLLHSPVDLELRRLSLQDLEWAAEFKASPVARAAVWQALVSVEPALRTEAEIQIERSQVAAGQLASGPHRWAFVQEALAGPMAEQHERAARFALWHTDDAPWPALLPELGKLLQARRPRLRADAVQLLLRARAAGMDVTELLERALLLPDAEPRSLAAVALGYDPDRVPVPAAAVERVDSALDFDTFAAFVHPVLMRPGTTGAKSCVECHVQLRKDVGKFMLVPAADGAPSDEELTRNYNAVLAYIDLNDPLSSPLLMKPLNPDRAIGAVHGTGHGGGVSWSEPTDPDFRTVLDWASGKKLDRGEQFHFDEFLTKVVPIFTEVGPTGDACWECHNTHNTLFMPEPENGENYTAQEARFLLDFVMRTVDLRSPQDSFVLNKPMYELDNPFREKDPNRPTHGGGIRWLEGKRSWQYRTLLTWIERVAGRR
jgi:hypothetical protein